MTSKVLMYCLPNHPGCSAAEQFLQAKGVTEIEKAYVDRDPELRTEMWARTERHTLPQIFVGNTHVGSFTELFELDQAGELDSLLKTG